MSITIVLPEKIENRLEVQAKVQKISVAELILKLVERALAEVTVAEDNEDWPTPEKLLLKLKALPPAPQNLIPATGSLADYLRQRTPDPSFDLEAWEKEWAIVEVRLKELA